MAANLPTDIITLLKRATPDGQLSMDEDEVRWHAEECIAHLREDAGVSAHDSESVTDSAEDEAVRKSVEEWKDARKHIRRSLEAFDSRLSQAMDALRANKAAVALLSAQARRTAAHSRERRRAGVTERKQRNSVLQKWLADATLLRILAQEIVAREKAKARRGRKRERTDVDMALWNLAELFLDATGRRDSVDETEVVDIRSVPHAPNSIFIKWAASVLRPLVVQTRYASYVDENESFREQISRQFKGLKKSYRMPSRLRKKRKTGRPKLVR